jgi:hypothetical protein
VGGKEQGWVKISNRFAALESLDDNVDISKAWESITESIITSAAHKWQNTAILFGPASFSSSHL